MKRLSILAGAMLIAAGAASAQLNINVPTREPKTNLVPAEWARMEKGFIDARTIIGKPEIFVVNATFDEINKTHEFLLNCRAARALTWQTFH